MGVAGEPVLITGGSGFIGSYVAWILLSEGRRAVSYDPQPLTDQARYVLGGLGERYTHEEGGWRTGAVSLRSLIASAHRRSFMQLRS